ncbi:MAG TPA: DUF1156 domain-containing protein [Candidatus Hydrogenedentes bacterium]|nr:DUF1156 domain-containing protein [Candidatus Hydrogenedentota bacterium]HRT20497.1 DUF1156 domain-containing protein [Candidatus Hydrogenedentota bacterium]HRT65168.1 DUF1156 domain-containing protein [Candidatus Hydrogenedentota bacterium]
MIDDKRLIEDYLPIEAISAEASREKSVRKGHISTLHLWWARRPLVACRAAVYGALVPASQFVPENGPDNKKQSLGRANAAKFVERLCKYPGDPRVIAEAQRHILDAHADRLTAELADARARGQWPGWVEEFKWPKENAQVTREDIEAGRAPRPRVLDPFAGGGAIPLEALRLGCEAYANDLNPVAHIIELCTLVYPQKYGKPDPNVRGMTGPKNAKGETTWGGLAEEVRYWGNWVLEKVRAEIGDLYPPLPDDDFWNVGQAASLAPSQPEFFSLHQGVAKTRRKLPHWEKEGACYFITYRVGSGITLSPDARTIVLDNLKHWSGQRYDLWQAVVMPDHVHALLSPLSKEDGSYWTLTEILHTAKSWTANQINKLMGCSGTLWQDERFDHIIRNPASFEEKWCYIRQNPCKAGLAVRPTDYPWLYEDAGLAARPTLTPVAYLWTRTVKCKNPACQMVVPLIRQTWLCKTTGRFVAMKIMTTNNERCVRFDVVEATSERGLGFDPALGSRGGNSTCPACGTVADVDYIKEEGWAGRLGVQFMAAICTHPHRQGKIYLPESMCRDSIPPDDLIQQRIDLVVERSGLSLPTEPIANLPDTSKDNTLGITVRPYGFRTFADLFLSRQLLSMLTFTWCIRQALESLGDLGCQEHARAIATYLACILDRLADFNSSLCVHNYFGSSRIAHAFGRQTINMVWDCAEANPFNDGSGGWGVDAITEALKSGDAVAPIPSRVIRGSATNDLLPPEFLDAVITDPPYYDNVPYADISDYFYVWLKRSIGFLYPEHFATPCTPKKSEAIADAGRHTGNWDKAKNAYECMMRESFARAHSALKRSGLLSIVYAHKTTLGWATLVDALRNAGFTVEEAWPLDTEKPGRLRAQESAALASSIFLIARKRDSSGAGSYEAHVHPELNEIVHERVDSLWKMGVSGADLVISCVGAGLRSFTRHARVEYANGEEVPAERFLAEVETVVLEEILNRLSKEVGGNGSRQTSLAGVDSPTRFYLLWRYTYRWAELDAGEAIVFANGTHVELDGTGGLSVGRAASPALVAKNKSKYRLRDFLERGNDEKLGLPDQQAGQPAPLIDALHRTLWLMEKRPRELPEFLRESRVNREQMRLVAQALAGPALKGGELGDVSPTAELAALAKLTANWRSVIEDAELAPTQREDRRKAQEQLDLEGDHQ